MSFYGPFVCLLGLLIASGLSLAEQPGRQGVYLAPGWGKLSFDAPEAGTYQLPALQSAAGGSLLSTDGQPIELANLVQDKVTLLSFIFRTCDDVNGCPLSTMVLRTVASRMGEEPELAKRLRLVTISFDPQNDTPAAMADYQRSIVDGPDLDWKFLTSESDAKIKPILDAYQQFVVRDVTSSDGRGKFSHILRVYLIDPEAKIRNIYNLSFLHPDILVNDVKTLLMEEAVSAVASNP
jgi:cytochrome c peroxidase